MTNNSHQTLSQRFFALLLSAGILCGSIVRIEAQSDVLAAGNPALTAPMINRVVALLEWSLQISFATQDRTSLQQIVVHYWQQKDAKSIHAIHNMLAFEQKMQGWSNEQKQQAQPQLQQKLLENMAQNSADEMNRLLQTIYRRSHSPNAATSLSPSHTASSNALAGKWQVLHGNSIVSADRTRGKIGEGNGMIAEYDIKPNGQVIYSFYLQQSNFGCTTRLKTSKTGRAVVAGSRITFTYDEGKTIGEDGCNAKYNYTKLIPASSETFTFELKSANGKSQFCFANEQLKDCAVKVL